MAIERKGKFLIDMELAGGLSIGIESEKLSACVEEARRRKAIGVFGAPCWGFKQEDLNFLAELPDLTSIWFWDVKLNNIGGVYELKHLKKFGIYPKRPGIDFSHLATLEELAWEYNEKDTGLETLRRLKLFQIWHYNPKKKTFDGIVVPMSVTEIQINWANPRSLDGLPVMPKLKQLEIARCRNLETLAALPQITPNLERLIVEASGKVSDGKTVVKNLPKLNFAFVHDAILVKDKKLVYEKNR